MAGYSSGNMPAASERALGDMSSDEFKERGMADIFAQVQGVLQEHPEMTAQALAQVQAMGNKRNDSVADANPDELKQAGLMDHAGNFIAPIKAKMDANPKLTIAAALAAAGLAVAAGVYAYKKWCPDDTPVAEVSNAELKERGLLDQSGNMLASVKAKMDENPKMTIAAALAATGLLVAGGIAISKKFSADDTPVADLSSDELQQRGLIDSAGSMLEPVKAALAENPKMSIAAALAATGLVIAGGVALHHSSSADTVVADMSDQQLEQVGLLDPSGSGLLGSVKDKLKANPKMSIAAALAAAAAVGVGAYAVHYQMNKPNKGKKGKHGKDDKKGKEKKDKGEKKEKKEKGDKAKDKKEKGGKKDKKGEKSRDLAGAGDSSSSSSSDSD